MGNSELVRFSRDGDQFHYLWAARRCLPLLSPTSGLIAVSIEGPSSSEVKNGAAIEAGEEIIDVAEYYGSQVLHEASSIKYFQLKHSTQTPDQHWTASGLEKTLKGFAARYKELCQQYGIEFCKEKVRFLFISNRPVSPDIIETVADVAAGTPPRHPKELSKLKKHTKLKNNELNEFCKLLDLQSQHEGYLDQRNFLIQDVGGYLPDLDVDAPVQLNGIPPVERTHSIGMIRLSEVLNGKTAIYGRIQARGS